MSVSMQLSRGAVRVEASARGRCLPLPPSPVRTTARLCAARPSRRSTVKCRADLFDKRDQGDPLERCVAVVPYLLPLLDVIPFGKFIFLDYPFVARAMAPLGPLAKLYHTVPFAPLIIFLVVYNGIVNNQSLSRFVRFNAMQAVLLDVLLIIPQVIIGPLFRNPASDPLTFQAFITLNNTIFLFVAVSVAYGMGASVVGQMPRLPLVASAADAQLKGPRGW